MRHLFSCFLLLIASYGCTSYRFAAIGENNDYVPKKKYRISTLTIHAPRGPKILQQLSGGNPFVAPDPWSIPQVASISNIEKLRLMVAKRHPSIFTQDESATPIDVNVYCTDERDHRRGLTAAARRITVCFSATSRPCAQTARR